MSTPNPDNYPGATVTVVGWAATDPRPPAYVKDGSRNVLELPIPIREGYKDRDTGDFVETGTTWYSYTAGGSGVDVLDGIQKGDKVRIENARQEVREYTNKAGETVKAVTLRFGTVSVLETSEDNDDAPF